MVDKNAARVAAWNSEELPFSEPGLPEVVKAATTTTATRKANLSFSTEVDSAIRKADLIFVAVETPSGKRDALGNGAAPNLTSFHAVLRHVAKTVEKDFILVNKSTVPCGAADEAKKIMTPHLRAGIKCHVLSNPEFLAEGTAVSDLLHPDRILIGSDDTEGGKAAAGALASLYAKWVPVDQIITMNSRSSELSKLAANALLAQRISSINALSAVCDKMGADITEVSRACGLDHRIGKGMLRSTLGFGGSCFEKDVLHLTNTAAKLGLPDVASYFESVVNINTYQTNRFTENIVSRVPSSPTGRRTVVGMLGFAFKPDTDDTRCSPAIPVIRDLVLAGYQVNIFDPLVHEAKIREDLSASLGDAQHKLDEQVYICADVYEACEGANGIAILNSWGDMKYIPSAQNGNYTTARASNVKVDSISKNAFQLTLSLFARILPRYFTPESSSLTPAPIATSTIEVDGGRIDWERIADGMQNPKYIFDGHNVLDHRLTELGFYIDGVGRPLQAPGFVQEAETLSSTLNLNGRGFVEKSEVQQLPQSWVRFIPVVE